jgi:hypothetical protein
MSMAGYTKLFNSILASTIWRAPDKTRIVWITLLAMADKDGVAEGSIPGLADMARVSLPDCEKALEELYSPDKYSRTTEYEGRRIEKIEGGWQILNHGKYREKMSADERREYFRKKQQEWRARKKVSKNVNHTERQSTLSTHTEADAEPNADAAPKAPTKARKRAVRVPLDCPSFQEFWTAYPRKEAIADAEAAWVANDCASKLPEILKVIRARKPAWQSGEPRFIPLPATWLNRRGWQDEVTAPPPKFRGDPLGHGIPIYDPVEDRHYNQEL